MATLEQIRTLTVRGRTEGLDRVQAELAGVSRAHFDVARASDEAAKAVDTSARRQQSASAGWSRLTSDMQGSSRAAREYAQTVRMIAQAEQQGLATAAQAAQARMYAQTRLQDTVIRGPAVDQSGLNALLGFSAKVGTAARESAAAFERELSRMEDIARQKAQQIGSTFQSALNERMGIGQSAIGNGASFSALEEQMRQQEAIQAARSAQAMTTSQQGYADQFGFGDVSKGARESAAAFEAAFREAEQLEAKVVALRTQLDPLAAVQARLNAELTEYRGLASAGAISAGELADAEAMVASRMAEAQRHMGAAGGAAKLTAGQVQNLGYQLNDAATMLLSGSSPFQVLATQGGQVVQALGDGPTGTKGSLAAIGSSIAGFSRAIGPVPFAVAGVTAAVGALWYMTKGTEARSAEASLKSFEDAIKRLEVNWKGAARAALEHYEAAKLAKDSAPAALLDTLASRQGLQADLTATIRDLNDSDALSQKIIRPFSGAISDSRREIMSLYAELRSGERTVADVAQQMLRIGLDPNAEIGARRFAEEIRRALDPAAELERQVQALNRSIAQQSAPRGTMGRRDLPPEVAAERFGPTIGGASRFGTSEGMEDIRQGLRDQAQEFKDAEEEVNRYSVSVDEMRASLVRSIDAVRLQASMFGQSEGALAAAQFRAEALAQAQDDAARAGKASVDPSLIAFINSQATEYGALTDRLAALNEAQQKAKAASDAHAESLRGMQEMLEGYALEADSIGRSAGAVETMRVRYQLLSQAKQAAFSEGRSGPSQDEINRINAVATAAGHAADTIERMRLVSDMTFERGQLFRSDGDAEIASALRGTGLGLDSVEANYMRTTARLKEFRDLNREMWTGIGGDILKNGVDPLEAVATKLKEFGGKLIDRSLENIGDSIFSGLFGSQDKGLGVDRAGITDAVSMAKTLGLSAATPMWVRSADPLSPTGAAGAVANLARGGIAANDNRGIATGGDPVAAMGNFLGYSEKGASGAQINAFMASNGVNIDAARTAWCAGFVNSALRSVGVDGTGSLVANSFLDWGSGVSASAVSRGDVLVKSRGLGVDQTGGHVGLATGATRMGRGGLELQMISGNQSNSVAQSWESASALSVRRASEALSTSATGLAGSATAYAQDYAQIMGSVNTGIGQVADQFVPGFGGILTNLLNRMSEGAGGGGIFGSIFGGVFGGSGISSGATSAILANPGGGFWSQGGYTGPGGMYEPAGVVHRGEIVWSQNDIARAGGIGAVEAMRLGMRGYAEGGPVGIPAAARQVANAQRMHAPANDADGGGAARYSDKRVFNIDARGAQAGVGEEIRKAIAEYDRQSLPMRVQQINEDPRKVG